jgi:hypothetical protein
MKLLFFALLILQSSLSLAFPYEDLPEYEKRSSHLWRANYSHEIIPVMNGDILIPIQIHEPVYTLSHPTEGVFNISSGGTSSVTRHPSKVSITTCNQYSGRPTLVISIVGWAGQAPGQASGIAVWQDNLADKIAAIRSDQCNPNVSAKLGGQIKYMSVDWHSANSNKRQVKALATFIRSWLSIKRNSWDIVLVGHSRGGIFAHDLSEKLKGVNKINSLHTVLLDPTGSSSVSDAYPAQLHDGGGFKNTGYLVYDNKGMINGMIDNTPFDSNIGAFGDTKINGYAAKIFPNSTHNEIPNDWMTSPVFDDFLSNVQSIKDEQTQYGLDGPVVDELLTIRVNQSYIDFSMGIEDGNLVVDGEVVLTPGLSTYGNTSIGVDGIMLNHGASAFIVHYSVQTVINEEQAYIAANIVGVNGVISLSGSDGFYTSVNVLGLTGADTSLNSEGFEANMVIGGNEIDIITSPSVDEFVGAVDDIGNIPGVDDLKDAIGNLGDEAGDILDPRKWKL